jgi:predicted phage-related endonuclease
MTNIPVEERYKWIRGTDVPAIVGVSRWRTKYETYHMKRQTIPEPNLDDNERVLAGKFLEPALATWASEKWDMKLRKVIRDVEHQTIPWFGCSLDYEEQAGVLCPVEIKNTDFIIFRDEYVTSEADRDLIEDAPMDYLLQIQSQLSCMPRAPGGWLIVCIGGNNLKRMWCPRNEGAIARIEEEVQQFQEEVIEGIEPEPDFAADADVIATLYASVDKQKKIDITDSNHLPVLCNEYLKGHEMEKAGKEKKKASWAEMLTIIEDACKGEVPERLKAFLPDYVISSWVVAEKFMEPEPYTREAFRSKRITERKKKDGEADTKNKD